MYSSIGTWAAEHGADAAAEVAAFEVDNLEAVKSLVDKERINCDLVVNNVFDVQCDEAYCAKLKAGLELLDANGLGTSDKVDFIPGETTETVRHSLFSPSSTRLITASPSR